MRTLLLALTLALLAAPAAAQPPGLPFTLPGANEAKSFEDVAEVAASIEPTKAKRGQTVTFKLTITPKPGCDTYPANPPEHQDSRNIINLPKPGDLIYVGPVTDPAGWHEKPS